MSLQIKFSTNYWAKLKRIQRLPKFFNDYMDTSSKKDAYGVIDEYRNGIKYNSFKLRPLKPATIEAKERKGFSKPSTPLYGLGEDSANSLINAFLVRNLKKGYRVAPRNAIHHTSSLKLKDLWNVHEFGITIRTKNAVIPIPARPAFFLAYKRYLIKKKKLEPTEKVRRAMVLFINTGKDEFFRRTSVERNNLKKYDS